MGVTPCTCQLALEARDPMKSWITGPSMWASLNISQIKFSEITRLDTLIALRLEPSIQNINMEPSGASHPLYQIIECHGLRMERVIQYRNEADLGMITYSMQNKGVLTSE